MDQRSFILGMITAFCECVAAGCKDLALSPPLTHEVYTMVHAEAEERFEWILIAAREETLRRYAALREEGLSPARSLRPFSELLSYNAEKSVSTTYDAYRAYFGS